MKQNYLIIQPWILAYEGGFVNHPKDPGGATNQGITQRTYDAYRRRIGHATQSVRMIDNVERDTIYRVQYWDAIRGDDLPGGVDAAVYDFAVNSGPSRAAKFLQRIVGVKQDGVIGLQTLDALARMDSTQVIGRLCVDRMAFLRVARNPKTGALLWPEFGTGWTRRVMGNADGAQDSDTGIIDRATRLARGSSLIPKPVVKPDGAGKRTGEDAPSFWARLIAMIFGGLK